MQRLKEPVLSSNMEPPVLIANSILADATLSLDGTNSLTLRSTSALSANRALTLTTPDADTALSLGGNFTTSGGSIALNVTGATSVTLPTSGTILMTTSNLPSLFMLLEATISSDDIKALSTTPVELLPAPGPGKIYALSGPIISSLVYGGVPYENGGNLLVGFEGSTTAFEFFSVVASQAHMIDDDSWTRSQLSYQDQVIGPALDFVDKKIILFKATSLPYTMGNSILKIKLWYNVVTL